jgi:hypothetical protein
MFNPDRLHVLHTAKPAGFTVFMYEAADRDDASAARNQLGFFPNDAMADGDALYIRGAGTTSHHWVQHNKTEDKLSVWLFGG